MVPNPSVEPVLCDRGELKQHLRMKQLEQYMAGLGQLGSAARVPASIQLEEKPIHTAVAYMMCAGATRKEIAERTGLSLANISQLAVQPWFKIRLREITDTAGKDLVKAFLEGEVLPSLEVLRTIRDDCAQRGATRITAANSILDRFLGKPITHVEAKTQLNIHTAADARDQVESELEKVRRELAERGVITSPN